MTKTLSEVQADAVELHGLAQGMDELLQCETKAARNAVFALSTTLIQKADDLALELDRLDGETRQ